MNSQIPEILRLLCNLIRIGTVSAVNLDDGLCRVDTGNNTTNWLHWLTARAGRTRSWNAPSVGEQVLVLCLGGKLDTGFILPGVFSDDNPAPSASADALHWSFPDGAVIEYEPASGALKATGIQHPVRDTGEAVTDLDHIRQSVRDILLTPVGSRVMRRSYGSLLSALIDQPQNEALSLQIMSACYMAILQWEPRVKLTGISY